VVDADTFFPALEPTQWAVAAREERPADDRNPHACSFEELRRMP
jgi:hypothetical protein